MDTRDYRKHMTNAFAFENIVEDILKNVGYEIELETNLGCKGDIKYDYKCHFESKVFFIEVKYFRSNIGMRSAFITVSKRLSQQIKIDDKVNSEIVIICANSVNVNLKNEIFEKFEIRIVDIGNLLYLVQYNEDLNNSLRSLLEFSVQDVVLEKPVIPANISDNVSNEKRLTKEYTDRLSKLKCGKKFFSKYEDLCIEILKYLFNDYLSLWNKQYKSNNDLYRFDLCCKIKYGEVEEFFDTVQKFFNTKYIIFEFKNYSEPITQKEIYTTEKYLYSKALRGVAIILSRNGVDDNGMYAIKGCLRESGKLILNLSDMDLLDMLKIKELGESPADYLSEKLDSLLLELEK